MIRFNTSGALKLSQLILSSQMNLDALNVVAFQLEGGPLVWIQNRTQIAQYLVTNKSSTNNKQGCLGLKRGNAFCKMDSDTLLKMTFER